MGISNLREFQYSTLSEDAAMGDRVNWSGEFMTGSWSHVASVNDPETQTTTMYVDGGPVLRNAVDTVGMTWNEGMPWILGADWADDAARNGWHGCIGETRIIDRATTAAEWLTQRADLSGLQISSGPAGELPAGTESATFSGTGFPGADVGVSASEATAGDAVDAVAAVAATPSTATTTVDADGRWSLTLTELSAESYDAQITQSFGARAADPVPARFSVAAAATPTPTPTDPGDAGGSGPDPGAGSDPGSGSGGAAEGALPATGLDQGLWMSLLALGSALLAVGATIATRARRRMRG